MLLGDSGLFPLIIVLGVVVEFESDSFSKLAHSSLSWNVHLRSKSSRCSQTYVFRLRDFNLLPVRKFQFGVSVKRRRTQVGLTATRGRLGRIGFVDVGGLTVGVLELWRWLVHRFRIQVGWQRHALRRLLLVLLVRRATCNAIGFKSFQQIEDDFEYLVINPTKPSPTRSRSTTSNSNLCFRRRLNPNRSRRSAGSPDSVYSVTPRLTNSRRPTPRIWWVPTCGGTIWICHRFEQDPARPCVLVGTQRCWVSKTTPLGTPRLGFSRNGWGIAKCAVWIVRSCLSAVLRLGEGTTATS